MLRHVLLGFCVLGAVSIGFACATSPTGRSQLILMPEGQLNSMGVQAFSQMKSDIPVETDPAVNKYVKCIAIPVAKEAGAAAKVPEWEIVVFRDESANAFALPGGKIGVHTGILKVAKTPDQLAAVLGHEVGHVIARHGNERVSQGLIAQGGLVAASVAMADSEKRGIVLAGLGLGAQFGVLLPFGRAQESESDVIGLDLMAKAGFDPRQSVELWHNMAANGGKGPPQFLSTHPSNETRIGNLQSHMADALRTQAAARSAGKNPVCTL